jgi:hypothetical protein
VTHGETRNPPATERAGMVTLRLPVRAPVLYPTEISLSGSGEGPGKATTRGYLTVRRSNRLSYGPVAVAAILPPRQHFNRCGYHQPLHLRTVQVMQTRGKPMDKNSIKAGERPRANTKPG